MLIGKINSSLKISGELFIKEGKALNQKIDEQGNIIDWTFYKSKEIKAGKNTICSTGLAFLLKRDWGIPMSIAVGNGNTEGSYIPAITDTSLNSELDNARFGIRGTRFTRTQGTVITLSALWNRGRTIVTPVTEWGIFVNETGTSVANRNTGFLLARKAQNYTKTDSTKDIELVWVITISAS